MEDSPRPKVRALLEGGDLLVGIGCGEEGGTGLTLVLYLREVGAAATKAWGAAPSSTGTTVGLPWEVAWAVAVVVGGGAAAAARPGLDLPTGGGEDLHTKF